MEVGGGWEDYQTVTISKMKETETYIYMEKLPLNRLRNIAFEKIRFGGRDYYGN